MIDAVLSYHLNPHTCGVAKFNQRLARELGVELNRLGDSRYQHPLISIKCAELPDGAMVAARGPYSLFLHDYEDRAKDVVRHAAMLYAANRVIADAVRPFRPDVIEAWCPSTLEGNTFRGEIHVLTFGMSHKLMLPYYEKLKTLLGATGRSYSIGLSCAVHEGNPWDAQMAETEQRMRELFGSHLRVLGYLGDDALVKEIDDCTAVAAFYTPALRANNTSAWAVVERGCPLVTNLDADSPRVSGIWSIDRETWTQFPRASLTGHVDALAPWSWARLTGLLEQQVPCVK